jgi:hypothetical protein
MDRRLYESIKYKFSPDEIRELGEALAREAQAVFDLREQKTNAVAVFLAQLKAANKRVADLTTKINNGYEVRDIECMYVFDQPRTGLKTLIRCDDSSEVHIQAMTLEEQQRTFNFPEGDDK